MTNKGWTHAKDSHTKSGKAIRHSLSAKGIKNKPVTNIHKNLPVPNFDLAKYTLFDPDNDSKYSANAGDYWNMNKEDVLKNEQGNPLWLLKDGEVFKKEVRKKDLKNDIYEHQKKQSYLLSLRKPVKYPFDGKKSDYFVIEMTGYDRYVVDNKGRITQYNRFYENPEDFSGQWMLYGVTKHHWSRSPIGFDEIAKNPKVLEGGYLWDMDNGTVRQWGGMSGGKTRRVVHVYPISRKER